MTTFYLVNAKMHPQLIFRMVATLMAQPRIMKILKNLPVGIPNIVPYQHFILIEKLHSQIIFCTVATLMVHPRIMKIHKNLIISKNFAVMDVWF